MLETVTKHDQRNKFCRRYLLNFHRYRTALNNAEIKGRMAETCYDILQQTFRPIAVVITIIAASPVLISRWDPVQSLFYPI